MAVASIGRLVEVERLASLARSGTDQDLARLRAAVVVGIHTGGLTVERAATLTGLREPIIVGWLTHATERH